MTESRYSNRLGCSAPLPCSLFLSQNYLTEVLTSVEESSISVNSPDLPIINSKTESCRSSSEVWLANEAGCAHLGIQSGNSESDGTWVPPAFCQRLLSTLEQFPQRLTGLKNVASSPLWCQQPSSAENIHSWTVPRNPHDVVVANRGSTQLVIQVIASSLGLLHSTVVCLLINYSTRLEFSGAHPLSIIYSLRTTYCLNK